MTSSASNHQELLASPVFWEEAWQKARNYSFMHRKRKSLEDTVSAWNQRAESFTENVMGEKGQLRVERVLNWLKCQGVNLEGIKILDIGAGPGPFALAFAAKAGQVVALEPAEEMVKNIKSAINSMSIHNVEIMQKTWEEVDPAKEGLTGEFDLVFASMTPGIKNWETIQKAITCSKKHVYISQFAGKRQSSMMEELWFSAFGEKLPTWPAHIIYILNLLYAKGFQLDFRIWEEKRIAEDSVEDAVCFFVQEMRLFGREEPIPVDEIRDFVVRRAIDGIISHEMSSRLGKILINLES